MKSTGLLLVSAVALAACTTANDPSIVSRLGDTPFLSGGTYTTGGGITLAVDIRENNGRTLLCGVWAQSSSQSILTKAHSRDVVARGTAKVEDTVLARDLAFLREVAPAADYGGSDANCILTDRPWQAGDEDRNVLARIPGHLAVREIDEGGGGFFVYFRPTGPGAGT